MLRFVSSSVVAVAATVAVAAQSGYVPERVFDGARGSFSDFEAMLGDLAKADVVFVGEQHDDPNTHRLELATLEGLARRRGEIIVSLEMFERDVQEPLEHFLMGHLEEEDFLKVSRPWPRYRTDYKPLVDYAISKDWHVVAANVPRALALDVSKRGFQVLQSKSEDERKLFARELKCPADDDYRRRFAEAMAEHQPGTTGTTGTARPPIDIERYYQAQCLKDETMAESVARAYTAGATGGKRPLVVHFNGAFHSDFGAGAAERVRRRLPDTRVIVVSMLPVENLDGVAPDAVERKRADYLVYTLRTQAK